MGTKLEGKTFFTCYNNGVDALIAEDILHNRCKVFEITMKLCEVDARELNARREAVEKGLSHLRMTPIFTFVSMERFSRSPWFTGTTRFFEELERYILDEGGKIMPAGFNVPFSNGLEIGLQGAKSQASELAYATGADEFIAAFGVTPGEILERSRKQTR